MADQQHTPRKSAAWLNRFEIPVLVLPLLALPLFIVFQIDQSALGVLVFAIAALVLYFAIFEASRPTLRQVMPIVVLSAIGAAGRILFAAFPEFKPIAAVAIIAGSVFGRRSGFMVGALSMLVSNFFFGQGAWTPWQMYAFGLIGWLSGVFADHRLFERRWVIYVWGFLAPFLYGLIINAWHLIGFVHPITWESVLIVYALGIQVDIIQSIATVVFLGALYEPWKKKLYRIKRKYAFV